MIPFSDNIQIYMQDLVHRSKPITIEENKLDSFFECKIIGLVWIITYHHTAILH